MKNSKLTKSIIKITKSVADVTKKSINSEMKYDPSQHVKLLESIDTKLAKQISLRENFKIGIVRGVGTVIGATIVAAIVISILGKVINQVDDVPIIRDIINETRIDVPTTN